MNGNRRAKVVISRKLIESLLLLPSENEILRRSIQMGSGIKGAGLRRRIDELDQ